MAAGHESFDRFTAGRDDVGRRLDRVARKFLSEQSLGKVFAAIRRGDIRVNGRRAEASYRIRAGDSVEVRCGLSPAPRDGAAWRVPPWFEAAVVLENDNILAIDKPAGLLTHGTASLETIVRGYLLPRIGESLSFTPGPLHRLDRNTSGLLLYGKSTAGAARFAFLLRSHSVRKDYLALLDGKLARIETWRDRLERDTAVRTTRASREGREVQCVVEPLCSAGDVTLVSVAMESGYTHQIRAQAALHAHPLLGDLKYGGRRTPDGFLLHARAIRLPYFDTVLGFRDLEAPLPPSARRRLDSHFGPSAVATALGGGPV